MHLLKNMGFKTQSNSFKASNIGSFSKSQSKGKGGSLGRGDAKDPPQNFIAMRYALDYDNPSIILEYKDPATSKLYHHKMRIRKLTKDTPFEYVLNYLKNKNHKYFVGNQIDIQQLQKLVKKLQKNLIIDDEQITESQLNAYNFEDSTS